MQRKLHFVGALLAAGVLYGQASSAPAEGLGPYVRRFSAGATLSVVGTKLVEDGSGQIISDSPVATSTYSTTGTSRRAGYGLVVQLALTERFAVAASMFRRSTGYQMTTDTTAGTDNPNTPADERTRTVVNEDTRARLFDIPVTVRYYAKDRHDPGPRWFVQGGGAIRRVSHIKTSISTTVNDGNPVCCDTTPASPAGRSIYGAVAGIGVQVIEPVGIRIVPEFRFTRWFGRTFHSFSTFSNRNQLEGMVSLTF
jgi:hypothetical protein